MAIYKLGWTRSAQPSCGGGFDPIMTGLEVLKMAEQRKPCQTHLRQKQQS